MTEHELQQYLLSKYPKENEECEWKEFKNMKNDFNGKEEDDVISYVLTLGKWQLNEFGNAENHKPILLKGAVLYEKIFFHPSIRHLKAKYTHKVLYTSCFHAVMDSREIGAKTHAKCHCLVARP